ncbi:ricin-type beta-trefoil lectin domain protein [Burkholderia alba]|uniref:ricin-type beta-trefoil lectin domain protein n=1 Tax=Burkholderia alba TaxID=2683677 RepID=UPI002B059938|nr:ricin-type beta-trefoil lectin domain protein [Burkholderia alba]
MKRHPGRLLAGSAVCFAFLLNTPVHADPVAANTSTALSLTPPMGFNDWARFQCQAQAPLDGTSRAGYSFQRFMQDQASAMSQAGLVSAGYTLLMVDDCWMARNPSGQLQGATTWGGSSQPGFDPDLTAYATSIHSLGMLAGLYNTSGAATCQGVAAGEQGHQQQDAKTYVGWGIDALKLDNCGATGNATPQQLFTTMANALGSASANTTRKILFDESAPAGYGPSGATKYETLAWVRPLGQMWRTGPDIETTSINANGQAAGDPWNYFNANAYQEGVYQSYNDTVALSRYVSPGNWNDPDQLLIGDNGMTTAEERSQMALWSVMAAPLIISADTRKFVANPQDAHLRDSLAILTNAEVIAVDQDKLGIGGYRVSRDDPSTTAGIDVIAKPLSDGALAVVVLNKGDAAVNTTLPLASLGYSGAPCTVGVRDLWAHTTTTATTRLNLSIGAHDNAMVKLTGVCGGWAPTGEIEATQTSWGTTPLCVNAARPAAGAAIALATCTASATQRWTRNANRTIQLAGTGLCVSSTAPGSVGAVNGASGQWATLASCNAQDTKQVFTYKLAGQLVAASNSTCVDVYQGAVGTTGTPIDLYPCGVNQSNQLWAAPHLSAPAS